MTIIIKFLLKTITFRGHSQRMSGEKGEGFLKLWTWVDEGEGSYVVGGLYVFYTFLIFVNMLFLLFFRHANFGKRISQMTTFIPDLRVKL